MSGPVQRKLPIGIQSFEKLRQDGFLYIDKTAWVYEMVHNPTPLFLSRPRRFGKSLLLSTLRAYWEGKRELFRGLAIEELERDDPDAWQSYPVFCFDFNRDAFAGEDSLERILDAHLKEWEQEYGPTESTLLSLRFQELLVRASERSGKRCVVLVDEYDKALLDTMADPALSEHNRTVFKGFFSTLKSFDTYLRFVFITGVTKFSKVSIFSDLNHLKDISLSEKYAKLCGITEEEMLSCLAPEITAMAAEQELSETECVALLRKTYDGYRFHPKGAKVYNPFSLLNALDDREFRSYWFSTGTPSFLVRKLRESGFDIRKLTDRTLRANESSLSDYSADNPDPVPLLYQTGYLTIVDYDRRSRSFTLAFPNEEVKYGFLENLLPEYIPTATAGNGLDIFSLETRTLKEWLVRE